MLRSVAGLRTVWSVVSCVIVLLAPLTACETPGAHSATTASLTTDTSSAQFATAAEKMAFLRRYVVLYSAVEATEFHIVYHDNAGGRNPGPSDWDMRVALKVAPADMPAWTSGLQEASRQALIFHGEPSYHSATLSGRARQRHESISARAVA